MNSTRSILVAAMVAAIPTLGCSDRVSQTALVRPQVGRYGISGQVHVVGRLTGEHGDSVGVRSLDTESGVRVRLSRPDASTDSVLTQDGSFEFRVDDPGVYHVSAYVCPEIRFATDVEVTDHDLVLSQPLTVVPSGTVTTYPNPFPSHDGLAIEFTVSVAGPVEINILTLAGVVVWTYAIDLPSGFQHFHWIGVDNGGHALANGPYWCVVRLPDGHRYNLVFKE